MKLVLSKQKNIYMIQSVFGMEEFFNFLMFVWSKYFEKTLSLEKQAPQK